ncbi:aldehyde dehydrogenase family protein [Streptomyces xiaopingdaonensis]|uniref:aldehyde dehydrogenase family protein n=1 Tax=Streptomyces xiaopingdaonensis TaxID=1565415 RepID=UPI00031C07C8|nr:aldehyde dehydrogenase family protein [Streptomyces xiaopingdaonensis]
MSPLLTPRSLDGAVSSGGWIAPDGEVVDSVEPATGEVLARVGLSGPDGVRRAAAQAAEAQRAWAASGHTARMEVLRRAADLLGEHREEFLEWVVRESGSVRGKAEYEVGAVRDELLAAAALAGEPRGSVLPDTPGRSSVAVQMPVGVVGVISPWNVPMVLSQRAVAPALALGNAVVLKPDPRTAVSGGQLYARLFEEAGLPEGVLHVVPGGAEAGAALVEAPEVGVIAFTGSTAVGRAIGERAGRALKRTSLELGGNNPLVVLEDADVEAAAWLGASSSFFHQGQVCMAAGRHIVVEELADAYVARLSEIAEELRVGDPWREEVELGPVIDEGQLARVCRLVEETAAGGARVRAGGVHRGLFLRPTVLDRVGQESPLFREETFGPVAPVVRVADEEEAVAVANDSEYGLVASVVTGDPRRGEALGARLRTGMVHVNDRTIDDDPYVPFGGVGASGNGSRHGVLTNRDEFTEWRWTTVRDRAVPTRL